VWRAPAGGCGGEGSRTRLPHQAGAIEAEMGNCRKHGTIRKEAPRAAISDRLLSLPAVSDFARRRGYPCTLPAIPTGGLESPDGGRRNGRG
jgi:hypothetical protein